VAHPSRTRNRLFAFESCVRGELNQSRRASGARSTFASRFQAELTTARPARPIRARLSLRGLLFGFGRSVASDAVEKVPTGGELTRFEAVGLMA
jgi:hypothetical protein